MRRLGAVGTLVWDTNWHPSVVSADGAPLQQWGGAIYSLSSLAAARPPGWEIVPIIKVGRDLHDEASSRIDALLSPGARIGLRPVEEPTNRVELIYHDRGERAEVLTGGVPAWEWPELAPLLSGLDAVYVNFVSGHELVLETAIQLRRAFGGLLYGDLHSLFLGDPAPGGRPPRPLPRWREWVSCFDVVQLNEVEMALLAEETPGDLLAELLTLGPRLVLVTLGPRGVRYAARPDLGSCGASRRRGRGREGVLGAPLGHLDGDPTGCGDVFGGAMVAGILAGLPLEAAIARAQRFAAAKMLNPSTDTLATTLAEIAAQKPNG